MKKWIVFLSLVMLGLGSPTVYSETVDKVVAVVNDEPVTLYQLDKVMSQHLDKIKEAYSQLEKKEKFKSYKDLALKNLIDEKLLEQEMKKRQVVVTDSDVDKAIENVMARNKLTMAQLKKELADKGQTWEEYKKELRVQLKRIKFMGQVIAPRVKVTDADLDEFFAKNSDKFSNFQSVEMAQIIIPLSPTASDSDLAAAQKKAQEVQKKASGGSDFEELGKKYSANPQTAIKDIYQVNQLAAPIVQILSDLKPGDVSEPVRSGMGMHVIKLFSRKTLAGEEYKVIREQLREKVFEMKVHEELEEYLDDVRSQSFIEIKA